MLDFVTSMVLASTYGVGMCLAAVVLFVWQGSIYALTVLLGDFISGEHDDRALHRGRMPYHDVRHFDFGIQGDQNARFPPCPRRARSLVPDCASFVSPALGYIFSDQVF